MGKKNRVPEQEQSAFESAKAAFDRVGEDYVPASKAAETAESPVTAEPANGANAPEPETGVDTQETSEPENNNDTQGTSEPENNADTQGTSEPENNADTQETSEPETGIDTQEASEPETGADTQEGSEPETGANTQEASEPEDSADTPEDFEIFTDPEPVKAFEFPDIPESDLTDMEKHTMETREITLGYRHSPPPEAAAETEPQETETVKEPRKKTKVKAFEQLKDALRGHESSDASPPSGSSRDAAIRKRVMQIEDEETRNYLLDRVLPQMKWYSTKSAQYQTMYYHLMAATILMGALIPVFSLGANSAAVKVIIALLGASVTAINAYIALHNYRDLWVTYRNTREDLIHHLYCYFNRAGVFTSSENLDVLLVNVCEDTLSKENGGWTTILQKT